MFGKIRQSAVVIFLLATALSFSAADFKIEWRDQHVEVTLPAEVAQSLAKTNWTAEQWRRVLSVFADQGNLLASPTLPPMAGYYSIESNKLHFAPQFPLTPDISYRAVFRPQNLGATNAIVSATHRIAAMARPSTTTVAAIYPSASKLPENLLKFYVHFSAPMSGGHIYDYIHLRDAATGTAVELPFLEIDEELWDPNMTRLTLFLDPGRIKRGVRPLEEIGPSFHPGKTYLLTISTNWLDARGAPLKSGYEKKFGVTEADRKTPDPRKWKLSSPKNKTAPLEVVFDKPLDRAIVERRLTVVDGAGKLIPGKVEISGEEQRWAFTPDTPWVAGSYQLQVPILIEDLAGNNVGKPFDLDLLEDKQQTSSDYVKLPFEVK
jgi:hypothetical protein